MKRKFFSVRATSDADALLALRVEGLAKQATGFELAKLLR
jgi:hypothetical protein